jgi:hypothetical protein
MNRTLKFAITIGSLVTSLILAGCGLGTSASNALTGSGNTPQTANMTGRLKGGQQPVSGASVYLYAVNNTCYGSVSCASTAITTTPSTVTTDANGNFSISSVSCGSCTSTTETYIVLAGGNPGLTNGTNNTQAVWLAALGPWGHINTLPFLQVNEITTVATAYALAPFMYDYAHIGAPSTNTTGLQNAFALVNSLVNIGTGWGGGPGLPSGATLTTDSLYALADIIGSCVNSTGGTSAGTNCGNLLNCSGASCSCSSGSCTTGGSAAADTSAAALALAKNPQLNKDNLFNLLPGNLPFATNLASTPPDWTLAIQYTDSSLNNTIATAVDSSGNLWVANAGSSKVTEITPGAGSQGTSGSLVSTGVNSYPSSPLTYAPNALAIDSSSNVWIAAGTGTSAALYELASGSYSSVARTCTNANLNTPNSVSIDTSGNVWVSNAGGNSVVMFASNCSGSSGTNYTGLGGLGTPVAIAAGSH